MTAAEQAADIITIAQGISRCTKGCGQNPRSADACAKCGAPLEPVYGVVEFVHLAGITYRQCDYWCRTGRLNDTANGSGSVRTFTPLDLDVTRLAARLLEAGFTVDPAFTIAHAVITGDQYRQPIADVFELVVRVNTNPTRETAS